MSEENRTRTNATSEFHPQSYVFCPPSSILRPLSSALRQMESPGFQDFAKIATEFPAVRRLPLLGAGRGGTQEKLISKELTR